MKLKRFVILLCTFSVLYFAGCGSTPKAEPEPEPKAQAEEKVTPEPVSEDSLQGKVEKARAAAVAAGAETYYPALLADTDKAYDDLKARMAANPDADYDAELNDILARYQSLEKASRAQAMKKQIEGMDSSSFDKSVFDKGTAALDKYGEMDSSASGAELLAQAEAAYSSYNFILNKGLTAAAGRERQAALDAKKNADSVKAGVAKKAEYTNASNTFKKADSAYVTQNAQAAYEGYKAAKEAFTELYETVKKNREEAQAAIDRAKQKVAESASYSAEADTIAPLTTQVSGIEAENAVLLSEDNLANPDDAVIDVESGLTAQTAEKEAAAAIAIEGGK